MVTDWDEDVTGIFDGANIPRVQQQSGGGREDEIVDQVLANLQHLREV
jgi:hypothetical protein